ncbi:MAG: DinB family protein, partial [Cohnella sp.]|nr:DinB family protein [Cohnella sp.]
MNFEMNEAVQVLERTPDILTGLLSGLSENWLKADEGENTWTPIQVVEHLIEGEKTNWIPRVEWIIERGDAEPFPPFDRYAHLRESSGEFAEQKLSEFRMLRSHSLTRLRSLIDHAEVLERRGYYPQFGAVKLKELLSTWVVHDLTHMNQILRVMAKRYQQDVGPWNVLLGILR